MVAHVQERFRCLFCRETIRAALHRLKLSWKKAKKLLAFLAVLGMFLESTVITLLLTPILVPVVTRLGIDPVHFGVVMMTTVTLGSMTPPVGVAMYTVCGMLKCSMDEYTREALPFLASVIVLIVILVLFPGLVLGLPNLVF